MKYKISLIFLVCLFIACNKDKSNSLPPLNTNYVLPGNPEALPIFDAANYGIYKGVVINAQDSTGTFKFNLYNNHDQPYALFYTNNKVQDSLIRYVKDNSGNMLIPQIPDTSKIPLNASFYYTYFSSYHIGRGPLVGFNIKASGLLPVMDVQLYNNATLDIILKERSDKQVYCYEGAYSGLDSGRIAFVISSDTLIGIRASIWNPQFFKVMSAGVSNNSFTINQFDDISGNTFIFTGSIQNNRCEGTWTKSSNSAIINQFTSKRTL
jgi:hypothetical protein